MKTGKSMLAVLLVLVCVPVALIGCSGGGDNGGSSSGSITPPPEPAIGSIQGVVRNFDTRTGIAGATINVYDGETLLGTVTTDADGTFIIDVDAGLDYEVQVVATGFLTSTYYGADVQENDTTTMETLLQLADTYSGGGTISGAIRDAVNDNLLTEVTVNLRSGLNNQTGNLVSTGSTDESGQYTIADLATGYYTAELSAPGYISSFVTVYCLGGQTTGNQNFSLSPVLAAGETRIVLTWNADPSDLDTHFTGPTTSGPRFHVAYYTLNVNDGTMAALDLDDTTSFGPETLTITHQIGGTYRYYVHDYSNDGETTSLALSNSGAQVKVYDVTGLVATFNVPANQEGTVWEVFELSGSTLTPINILSYSDSYTLP